MSEHFNLQSLQRLRRLEMRAVIDEDDFKRMEAMRDITRVLNHFQSRQRSPKHRPQSECIRALNLW
jgi:hypothetical protein